MLAAQIGDGNAGLMLLQDSDDLLFRKAASLHALVLVLGQNELQTGVSPRGKVTGNLAGGGCHRHYVASVGVMIEPPHSRLIVANRARRCADRNEFCSQGVSWRTY